MSDVLQFLTKVEFFKISLCQIMQVKGNKHEREKERATCPTDAVQTCWKQMHQKKEEKSNNKSYSFLQQSRRMRKWRGDIFSR